MSNYNQIDLDKVKTNVSKYAVIDDSKAFILNEEVPFNPLIISRNINETNEILTILKKNITISFDGIININDIFNKSKKDIILSSKELSEVLNFHNHCVRIKNIINSIEDEFEIKDYTESLNLNFDMSKKINDAIDNYGNVKDDASNRLKEILKEININEDRLTDKANEFLSKHASSLQELTVYERNNRVSFLFKNSDKNKFNGFTYGTSASGLATYVEPEIFINLNNNRTSLLEEKEEEINRILRGLTSEVSKSADDYVRNFESIVKLNVIYAKAKYGYENLGVLASIGDNLYIKDVAHPLIDSKSVVTNTYSLSSPYKGIVISGTNTGGKTVGLKCIGLSVMMSYLGIPIISAEATIPLYDNIFVDIDDNQSIFNSLSTFSAHISNINRILNNATNKSLILIDELISGTDPKEAQAISLAILKNIEEIGSFFVITTHYDDIKSYAFNNDLILLSSVGFDNVNLKPTYKYIENSVGSSNALDIAYRYFDNKELISYAKKIIVQNSSKEEELMTKLEKEIENNEKLNNLLENQVEQNRLLEEDLKTKIENFEIEKSNLKKKYENSLNEYIEDIKSKAIDKLESIQNKNDTRIIDEIDALTITSKNNNEVSFEKDDNVKVGSNDAIGKILDIIGNKALVNLNGISIKTELTNLTKMPKTTKSNTKTFVNKPKSIKKELNVVGKHIDEAIIDVEYFLDEAQLNNLSSVKIIHGIGTGQLRTAIRDKLKKLKFVKSFNDGDYHDGGSAVTMVNLK